MKRDTRSHFSFASSQMSVGRTSPLCAPEETQNRWWYPRTCCKPPQYWSALGAGCCCIRVPKQYHGSYLDGRHAKWVGPTREEHGMSISSPSHLYCVHNERYVCTWKRRCPVYDYPMCPTIGQSEYTLFLQLVFQATIRQCLINIPQKQRNLWSIKPHYMKLYHPLCWIGIDREFECS